MCLLLVAVRCSVSVKALFRARGSSDSFHVVFHQTSLNSDEGECRGWSCVCFRGIFYQGYRCTRCKMAAHKECLGRVPVCGRNSGETDSERVTCDCVDVFPSLDLTCASHSLHRIIWNAEEGLSVWKLSVFVTFFFYSFISLLLFGQ